MTAKARERYDFERILIEELGDFDGRLLAGRLLRAAATLQRLHEAECNGDYPCDNGQRYVEFCTRCGAGYVPTHLLGGLCDSCRREESVRRLLKAHNLDVEFNGDPRGAPFFVIVPSGRTNDLGQRGIYVPA